MPECWKKYNLASAFLPIVSPASAKKDYSGIEQQEAIIKTNSIHIDRIDSIFQHIKHIYHP
jgi:hypothetical protein